MATAQQQQQSSAGFSLFKPLWRSSGGGTKKAKVANLGEESSMYYNQELKRWVERGKEDEAMKEAAGPPPLPQALPPALSLLPHYKSARDTSGRPVSSRYVLQSNLSVSSSMADLGSQSNNDLARIGQDPSQPSSGPGSLVPSPPVSSSQLPPLPPANGLSPPTSTPSFFIPATSSASPSPRNFFMPSKPQEPAEHPQDAAAAEGGDAAADQPAAEANGHAEAESQSSSELRDAHSDGDASAGFRYSEASSTLCLEEPSFSVPAASQRNFGSVFQVDHDPSVVLAPLQANGIFVVHEEGEEQQQTGAPAVDKAPAEAHQLQPEAVAMDGLGAASGSQAGAHADANGNADPEGSAGGYAAVVEADAVAQAVEVVPPGDAADGGGGTAPAEPAAADGAADSSYSSYYYQQYAYLYQHAVGQGMSEAEAVTYAQYYAQYYAQQYEAQQPSGLVVEGASTTAGEQQGYAEEMQQHLVVALDQPEQQHTGHHAEPDAPHAEGQGHAAAFVGAAQPTEAEVQLSAAHADEPDPVYFTHVPQIALPADVAAAAIAAGPSATYMHPAASSQQKAAAAAVAAVAPSAAAAPGLPAVTKAAAVGSSLLGGFNHLTSAVTAAAASAAAHVAGAGAAAASVAAGQVPELSEHDFDGIMHPGHASKMDGPLPWELPEPVRMGPKFLATCANWHRENPGVPYDPRMMEEESEEPVEEAVGQDQGTEAPGSIVQQAEEAQEAPSLEVDGPQQQQQPQGSSYERSWQMSEFGLPSVQRQPQELAHDLHHHQQPHDASAVAAEQPQLQDAEPMQVELAPREEPPAAAPAAPLPAQEAVASAFAQQAFAEPATETAVELAPHQLPPSGAWGNGQQQLVDMQNMSSGLMELLCVDNSNADPTSAAPAPAYAFSPLQPVVLVEHEAPPELPAHAHSQPLEAVAEEHEEADEEVLQEHQQEPEVQQQPAAEVVAPPPAIVVPPYPAVHAASEMQCPDSTRSEDPFAGTEHLPRAGAEDPACAVDQHTASAARDVAGPEHVFMPSPASSAASPMLRHAAHAAAAGAAFGSAPLAELPAEGADVDVAAHPESQQLETSQQPVAEPTAEAAVAVAAGGWEGTDAELELDLGSKMDAGAVQSEAQPLDNSMAPPAAAALVMDQSMEDADSFFDQLATPRPTEGGPAAEPVPAVVTAVEAAVPEAAEQPQQPVEVAAGWEGVEAEDLVVEAEDLPQEAQVAPDSAAAAKFEPVDAAAAAAAVPAANGDASHADAASTNGDGPEQQQQEEEEVHGAQQPAAHTAVDAGANGVAHEEAGAAGLLQRLHPDELSRDELLELHRLINERLGLTGGKVAAADEANPGTPARYGAVYDADANGVADVATPLLAPGPQSSKLKGPRFGVDEHGSPTEHVDTAAQTYGSADEDEQTSRSPAAALDVAALERSIEARVRAEVAAEYEAKMEGEREDASSYMADLERERDEAVAKVAAANLAAAAAAEEAAAARQDAAAAREELSREQQLTASLQAQLGETRALLEGKTAELDALQADMDELLLCLGQESNKVSALSDALAGAGVDPESIVEAIEAQYVAMEAGGASSAGPASP